MPLISHLIQNLGDPYANLGAGLGAGVGAGLESGLANFQQQQAAQQQKQSFAAGLKSLGFTDPEALQIASLPPQIQQEIVKQKLQAPGQASYLQALNQILGPQQEGQPVMAGEQQVGTLMQPQTGPFGIPAGLTQQQATELTKLQLQKQKAAAIEEANKQKISASKQANIEKHNMPWITNITNAQENSRNILEKAIEVRDLITNSPDIRYGLSHYGPNLVLNPNEQKLRADTTQLALLKAAATGKGVLTDSRVKLEQVAKPGLDKERKVNEEMIDSVIKAAYTQQLYSIATERVIKENGGVEPDNLRTKAIKKQKELRQSLPKDYYKFPLPFNLPDGAEMLDDNDKVVAIIDDGLWRKV